MERWVYGRTDGRTMLGAWRRYSKVLRPHAVARHESEKQQTGTLTFEEPTFTGARNDHDVGNKNHGSDSSRLGSGTRPHPTWHFPELVVAVLFIRREAAEIRGSLHLEKHFTSQAVCCDRKIDRWKRWGRGKTVGLPGLSVYPGSESRRLYSMYVADPDRHQCMNNNKSKLQPGKVKSQFMTGACSNGPWLVFA